MEYETWLVVQKLMTEKKEEVATMILHGNVSIKQYRYYTGLLAGLNYLDDAIKDARKLLTNQDNPSVEDENEI